MRILLTGNRGFIGQEVEKELLHAGHEIIGFDIADGNDILDQELLMKRMEGCEAMVHLAAIESNSDVDTMNVNVLGTRNVLLAVRSANTGKMIFTSSADVLGVFQGEGDPIYLPLDDEHPCYPKSAYSLSKMLAENMCRYFHFLTGTTVIILRPPGVWNEKTYSDIQEARSVRPEYEWDPYWEYGAFIDARDLTRAVRLALKPEIAGFHRHLIAADDITTSGKTSLQLVKTLLPNVLWRGDEEYIGNPYKSLILSDNVKNLLGWLPEYSWKRFIDGRMQ